MASITPRASGFWADSDMATDYFQDTDDVEHQRLMSGQGDTSTDDTRTPLDKTIDRIGMGSYQWTLLSLCGFGWMADNMWIQAIAIILPRVQRHYSVPDSYIGTVSSSMFAGMMFGAVGWGTCSDLMGRSAAFNATLFFTSLFGLMASFANSFSSLCIVLFFLGSAVGGSMPTDGTLLLEHMPKGKQYLVTALSVFFSFGAVLSAVVALYTVPQHSCLNQSPLCDVETQNQGWKYLLVTLGLITLSMFLARIAFFRLHESPRYLVHAGRPQEAIRSLQMISRFNGSDLSIELEDVMDHRPLVEEPPDHQSPKPVLGPSISRNSPKASASSPDSGVVFDGTLSPSASLSPGDAGSPQASRPALIPHYDSTGESHTSLDTHSFTTPMEEHTHPPPFVINKTNSDSADVPDSQDGLPASSSLRGHPRRRSSTATSSIYSYERKVWRYLPRWLRRPLWAWWDRVMMVLAPEWLRTTVLVWAAWWAMSLAYTMFNVYLPKLLETRPSTVVNVSAEGKSLEESLWDVVIFTIGGCPGAILGAYMIESSLGRRWSLAGSTFITAFFCVVFVMVESSWAVRLSTVAISLSATAMWAVLYGWTPEIFGTKVRGTACGIASALSRIGGMIAPMLGGALLMVDRSVPVYTSVVVFVFAGSCVLMLREGEGDSGDARKRSTRIISH